MIASLSPQDAWQPLPESEWNADAARHLLRRAGWTARPEEVTRAVSEGLPKTLDRLFPATPILLAKPPMVARVEDDGVSYAAKLKAANPDERRMIERGMRERAQTATQDMTIKWLQLASRADSAAYAKWVLFFSDIYVVSTEKVRNPGFIHEHFDIIARHGLGPAPILTKAISRSPAMVIYLDLNQSNRTAPNENFARELFELFVLGEGNYTEQDIKEAARAFTGYRAQAIGDGFRYVPQQHDGSNKTVFGQTGNFTGDEVIDLAYKQDAAAAFVPHELVKFYLSDTPLPPEYNAALGQSWRAKEFNLRALAQQFFGSRLFFAPDFRANFIKSPLQLYLGLVQDLNLNVAPLPRFIVNPLRQMGQVLFNPPNVRGWVGGRNWINSATLAARRNMVETFFNNIDEASLNADEQIELVAARAEGIDNFTVTSDAFASYAGLDNAAASAQLATRFLPAPDDTTRASIQDFLSGAKDPREKNRRLRRATVTLLESPDYQLC